MRKQLLQISSSDLEAAYQTAKELVSKHEDEIRRNRGRLRGEHWFTAVLREAVAIVKREKAWKSRVENFRASETKTVTEA